LENFMVQIPRQIGTDGCPFAVSPSRVVPKAQEGGGATRIGESMVPEMDRTDLLLQRREQIVLVHRRSERVDFFPPQEKHPNDAVRLHHGNHTSIPATRASNCMPMSAWRQTIVRNAVHQEINTVSGVLRVRQAIGARHTILACIPVIVDTRLPSSPLD
jgi:hypothetical protein